MMFIYILSSMAWSAEEAPQMFTLDGRLYSNAATGTPLRDTGTLKIQILDSSKTCVLYEEQQSFDTTATKGAFNLHVGEAVSPIVKRSSGDSGHSMAQVFANTGGTISGKTLANGSACTGSGTSGSERYVRIVVTADSDPTPKAMDVFPLDSIPSALVAESLGGIGPSGFARINTLAPADLSQANLEEIFSTTNYPKLTDLLDGTSSLYAARGANGAIQAPAISGTPSSPAAGQIWFDSGVLKYWDGSAPQALSAGSGVTSLIIGAGLTPTGTITTGGSTIAVDVGVTDGKIVQVQTGGKLPALDGSDLTGIVASSFSSTGSISTSGNVSATAANFKNLTLTNAATQTVTIQPAVSITGSPLTFTWPDAMPASSGYVLSSTTGGVLSWVAQPSSGLAAVSNTASLANGKTWVGDGSGKAQEKFIGIADIRASVAGNAQFFPTTCTAGQTMTWQSGTDTMICTNISLATSALTGSVDLTSQVTGTLPIANGGTGSATQNFVDLTTAQTVAGVKTWSNNSIFSGNVGIGTTSANSKLTVEGAMTFGQLSADPAGTAGYGSLYAKNDGKLYFRDGTGTITDLTDASGGGGGTSQWTTVGSDINYSSGNVGVGITPAGAKLHVRSADNENVLFESVSTLFSSSAPEFNFRGYSGNASNTSEPTILIAGIRGTPGSMSATQPGDPLGKVYFTGTNGLFTGSMGGASIGAVSSEDWSSLSTYGTDLVFSTTSMGATVASEKIRVTADGKVGIGTATPGDMLDVQGKIRATHICATNGTNCKDLSTAWGGGTVDLTSGVTGVLPVANGGTNSSTTLNNNRLMISSGGKIVEASAMTDGQIVVGKTSSAPQLVTMSGDASINNTGAVTVAKIQGVAVSAATPTTAKPFLRFDGSSWVPSAVGMLDLRSNVTGTQTLATTCSASQTLTYNSATDSLACSNISLPTSQLTGSVDLTSQVTGTLPIANGGTGSATQNFVDLTTAQTVAGVKTWSNNAIFSGNVGIGTTSPATTLDVNGVAGVAASTESMSAYTNSSTSYTIPDASVNIRRITLTGNATITLPAFTTSGKVWTLTVMIKQDGTGSRTLAWATSGSDSILWDQNASAPTPVSTANKVTIYQFTKPADETTWYASIVWKQN